MQVIVIMDPATSSKPRLHMVRLATGNVVPPKEKRYVFDKAYDGNTDNRTLYYGTVKVPHQHLGATSACLCHISMIVPHQHVCATSACWCSVCPAACVFDKPHDHYIDS